MMTFSEGVVKNMKPKAHFDAFIEAKSYNLTV
jgi:hypothetical protein